MKKINLLGTMMLCGVALFGCSDKEVEQVEEPKQTQEEQTKEGVATPEVETPQIKENKQTLGLGDTTTINYIHGDAEITFTNAYFTNYRNEFADEQPDKVLTVEFEYKNISFVPSEDDIINGLYFGWGTDYTVYGEDGFALTSYPYYPVNQQSVSVGHSSKGAESFAVNGDQHHFEIELYDGQVIEFAVE